MIRPGSLDRTIKVWMTFVLSSLLTMTSTLICAAEPVELPIGEEKVVSLAFSPDGQLLAVGTGGRSPTLKVFELASRKERLDIPCPQRGAAFSVAFHPDGKQLAVADYNLAVSTRRLSDGSELAALPGDPDRKTYRQARCTAYSPDGRSVIAGYSTGDIFVWDLDKQQVRTKFDHGHEITAIAVSHDGKAIATGTGWGLRVWNSSDGKQLIAVDQKSSGVHEVHAIRFLPATNEIVTADSPGWIRKFSLNDGKETGAFKMPSVGPTSTVYGLDVTNNGKTIVAPGLMAGLDPKRPKLLQDGLVIIDTKTMMPHSFLATGSSRVIAVSPDGKVVAMATGDTGDPVRLHELSQAQSLK